MAPDTPESRPAKAAPAGKPAAKPAAAYSGRFLVRMSGDLHQQLAQAAEREQVSLNRFVTDALAESVTGESAHEPDAGAAAKPDAGAAAQPATSVNDPSPAERTRNPRRTLRMVLAANVVVVVLAGTIAVVLLVLALRQGL